MQPCADQGCQKIRGINERLQKLHNFMSVLACMETTTTGKWSSVAFKTSRSCHVGRLAAENHTCTVGCEHGSMTGNDVLRDALNMLTPLRVQTTYQVRACASVRGPWKICYSASCYPMH